MPAYAKLLIGLAVALIAGWISHGPLGQGEAFVAQLQARAEAVVREAELPQVRVDMARAPLARQVLLSGPADHFQREGQGSFPGLNDRIRGLPGVAGLRWADDPAGAGRVFPLLAETLLMALAAFLIGLSLGKLLFRPRREGYL
ncbi:MAG: hypothetical protein ACXWU1_11445 [Allosphingosinicella sp.]